MYRSLSIPASTALALTLLLSTPSRAQDLLAYEGFDYGVTSGNVTTLAGKNGGNGWASPWAGVAGNALLRSTYPLDFSLWDAGPTQAHGTLGSGGYSLDVPPAMFWSGASLSLSKATQDYVDLTPHLGEFATMMRGSISLWFKTGAPSPMSLISVSESGTTNHAALQILGNGRAAYTLSGHTLTSSGLLLSPNGEVLADDLWHHLVLSVDGNGLATMYVDGVQKDQGPAGFFGHVPNLDQMSIGRTIENGIATEHYTGLIDEIAIWGSPLTAADVATLYNPQNPPPSPPVPAPLLPPLLVPGPNLPNGPDLAADSLASPAFPHASFSTFGLFPRGNRTSHASGNRSARVLMTPLDATVTQNYYLSFLVRRTDNGPNLTPLEITFADVINEQITVGWNDKGEWITGFRNQETGVAPQVMKNATTYFAVLKIAAESGFANDQLFLKVFESTDTLPPDESMFNGQGPTANDWTVEGSSTLLTVIVDQIWVRQLGAESTIDIDEIRIGTTWASVVDVNAAVLAAQAMPYGTACSGASLSTTGTPVLGANIGAGPVFSIDLSGGVPNDGAIILLGLGSRNIDLGVVGGTGCTLLVAANLAQVAVTTDANGDASVILPIPDDPLFANLTLYAQFAAIDTAAAFPFRLTEGLQMLLGR